jgi:DedD protein
MERDRKIYETYVVNLDNSRLFWLSVILLLFLCLAFLAGLFIGRKFIAGAQSRPGISQPVREGQSVSFENVLLPATTESTQYSNLEFYRILPKEKLTSEDIEHSIPYKDKPGELKPLRQMQKPAIVETKFPAVSGGRRAAGQVDFDDAAPAADRAAPKPRTGAYHQPARDPGPGLDSRPGERARPERAGNAGRSDQGRAPSIRALGPGPDRTRPYAIQVASYQSGSTAEAIRNQLESDRFTAFVIKARINNRLYYRVRLGPYASQAKADSALAALRQKAGFSGAYVCTD